MTTAKARTRRRVLAGALVVVLVVLGVVLTRDDGSGDPDRRLESLGVSTDEVGERWNDVVERLEAGDPLGEIEWVLDEGLELEVGEQAFESWGLLELYREPDGKLVAVDLVGAYVSDADRIRFRANALAGLSAAGDLDDDDAATAFDQDLGFGDAAASPSAEVDRGRLHIAAERTAMSAQIRITGR